MRMMALLAVLALGAPPCRAGFHLGLASAVEERVKKLDSKVEAAPDEGFPQYGDEGVVYQQVLPDGTNDLALANSEAPPSVIPYPPADITGVYAAVSGNYLYVKFTFNALIPTGVQSVSGQVVTGQGTNLSLDSDNNPLTGAAGDGIAGVDIFFAVNITYGASRPLKPYANFGFPSGNIHNNTGSLTGAYRSGGPGYSHVVARWDISGLGAYFPRSTLVKAGSWSEAPSTQYHHFAYDAVTALNWTTP